MDVSHWSTESASVRDDLAAVVDEEWARLGRPGTWWSAHERVAIARSAREVRDCALCAERRVAVSPYAVGGAHTTSTELPPAVVDGVHRLASDPGRITERWSRELIASGLSDAHVVELIGVIATQTMVDTFSRGVGRELLPPPAPAQGAPSLQRPTRSSTGSARLPTVEPDDAEGKLRTYYERAASALGVPNIMKALSLVPEEHLGFFDRICPAAYVAPEDLLEFGASTRSISRPQVELIAATVSAANNCFY